MSRIVDKLPNPSQVRPMKVVGLGASRTGTLGLYQALKILGYHPFHISDLIPYGIQQMKALQEAIISSQSNEGSPKYKPFSRADFDKMWGEYDLTWSDEAKCIVESPCYLGTTGLKTYLEDPTIKFILTERTPLSFAKSVSGSLGTYNAKLKRFPLSVAKYFDAFLWELSGLFGVMTARWTGNLIDPEDPAFQKALEESYVEYMNDVKALVPANRLLVLNLEKGFGWEEICEFLEDEVPDTPYPRINSMSDFHVAAAMIVAPASKKAFSVLGSSVVAILGVGVWWWGRYRR